MHDSPRCGAMTRAGTPCMAPAMANGRCRMHGGKSLSGRAHGRYKHGHFTKDSVAKRRELNELLRQFKKLLEDFNGPA